MPKLPRLLTPNDVAEVLGITPARVTRAYATRPDMAWVKIAPRQWRISEEDFSAWLFANRRDPRRAARAGDDGLGAPAMAGKGYKVYSMCGRPLIEFAADVPRRDQNAITKRVEAHWDELKAKAERFREP